MPPTYMPDSARINTRESSPLSRGQISRGALRAGRLRQSAARSGSDSQTVTPNTTPGQTPRAPASYRMSPSSTDPIPDYRGPGFEQIPYLRMVAPAVKFHVSGRSFTLTENHSVLLDIEFMFDGARMYPHPSVHYTLMKQIEGTYSCFINDKLKDFHDIQVPAGVDLVYCRSVRAVWGSPVGDNGCTGRREFSKTVIDVENTSDVVVLALKGSPQVYLEVELAEANHPRANGRSKDARPEMDFGEDIIEENDPSDSEEKDEDSDCVILTEIANSG